MLRKILILSLWGSCCYQAIAQHTGIVFEDKNLNGIQDPSEKGLEGVPVSDGLHVVKTDSRGYFQLPGHQRERFIFVTTPDNYMPVQNHYLPIEKAKDSYSFGLKRYRATDKSGAHRFVHISDTEIFNTQNHEDWVNGLKQYANNEQIGFMICTGDICYENGLKNHIKLMNSDNMHTRMVYTIGNHDLVKGKYGEALFESIYGPVYYSFDLGNVHYVITPMLGGDHRPNYTKEDVYRWLKNDLAQVPAEKAVVFFNHDLLTNSDAFVYGINEEEKIDLNSRNLKAWLYGHWHIHYMKKQGEVLAISTAAPDKGGIDHSTSAFRVMHVDKKGDCRSELRYSYLNNQIEVPSVCNGKVPVLKDGSVPLSVNVYHSSSPVKRVSYTYRIAGSDKKYRGTLQQNTDWNWSDNVKIPAGANGKRVDVIVSALLGTGEEIITEKQFEYHAAAVSQPQLTENWNNLLGNAEHIGLATASLDSVLHLSWIRNVGANLYMSSPLVVNGNVFVASVDENLEGKGAIISLEGTTGAIRWKYPVRNSIKNSMTANNGTIYAQDAEGYLYAVDAASGSLVWERKLDNNPLPALIEGIVSDHGIVYAGTGKSLCALDGKSGAILWQNKDWGQHEGSTNTIAVGKDILVNGTQWGALYGNDPQSGKMLWKNSAHGLSDRGASAAIHGNQIYIVSRKSFFILDAQNGRILIRKELPVQVDGTSTPLLTDREIIFGTSESGVMALDNETLEEKWHLRTDPALVFTAPYTRKPNATFETSAVLSGSTVFIGSSNGILYGINKSTGQITWQHATGAPIFSTVAVSGNALIATDFAGNVYAFSNKN